MEYVSFMHFVILMIDGNNMMSCKRHHKNGVVKNFNNLYVGR